jgi:hypothetical protein
MLVRKVVCCNACAKKYVLRFAVGLGVEQRLGWGCPICAAESRAHFSVKSKDGEADFKTDDVTILDGEDPTVGMGGVNRYSDLPVHKSSQGKGLNAGGSAWIQLRGFMGEQGYLAYIASKEAMQSQRLYDYALLRRASGHYKRDDWTGTGALLSGLMSSIGTLGASLHPAFVFSCLTDTAFLPILDISTKGQTNRELLGVLDVACKRDQIAYLDALMTAFDSQGFREARARSVDAAMRIFDSFDALVLPLATERFTPAWRQRLAEFRVFRDDFDSLKALYVDIFESMNQVLMWVGTFLNLGRRRSTTDWSDGKSTTFASGEKNWRAVDREFIVDELPNCKTLLAKASRSFRNDVGHFSVRVDITTGELVLKGGARTSLLSFHEDLLNAARVQSVLLTFCERLTLEYETKVKGESFDGWEKRSV